MFIIIEGLDRTGKSTIAEIYKKSGFKVIHFDAPDKKYYDPSYVGPSYLDDIVEKLVNLSGQDVVFDRSWYGEKVWPLVYNRSPLLNDDDLSIIREIEDLNDAQRFLLIDRDYEAHLKRCIDNNEPMNKMQFDTADKIFKDMAKKLNFKVMTLHDFKQNTSDLSSKNDSSVEKVNDSELEQEGQNNFNIQHGESNNNLTDYDRYTEKKREKTKEQETLEKANAINSILSKRIIRQKGEVFDDINLEIESFLNNKLKKLLNNTPDDLLSKEELVVLKLYAKKILNKQKELK